jgi:hypothetical protein
MGAIQKSNCRTVLNLDHAPGVKTFRHSIPENNVLKTSAQGSPPLNASTGQILALLLLSIHSLYHLLSRYCLQCTPPAGQRSGFAANGLVDGGS